MQFTVTINQVKAIEWGLNLPQANLFAFVYECPSWCRPYTKDGEVYYVLSKTKVSEELPLLGAPDTVYRNLKELEKVGVIDLSWTNQVTLIRITDKGREWNRKITSKPDTQQIGSEKYPTNKGAKLVGKKSDPGRKNIRSGSENSPTNQYTNQLTPSLSECTSENTGADDHPIFNNTGQSTKKPCDRFSMHREWCPAPENLSAELLRRGMPISTRYEPGWLADFTAHYADQPGRKQSESAWTSQFAKWIQQNINRQHQATQNSAAGGNRHENSQSTRNRRRTAAEARAAAAAGEYKPRRRRTAAEARAAAESERAGVSGRIIEGSTHGC